MQDDASTVSIKEANLFIDGTAEYELTLRRTGAAVATKRLLLDGGRPGRASFHFLDAGCRYVVCAAQVHIAGHPTTGPTEVVASTARIPECPYPALRQGLLRMPAAAFKDYLGPSHELGGWLMVRCDTPPLLLLRRRDIVTLPLRATAVPDICPFLTHRRSAKTTGSGFYTTTTTSGCVSTPTPSSRCPTPSPRRLASASSTPSSATALTSRSRRAGTGVRRSGGTAASSLCPSMRTSPAAPGRRASTT